MNREQREAFDRVLEYAVVKNVDRIVMNGQHVLNPRSTIRLAFVLGVRFGLSRPFVAGDYMGQWCQDHVDDLEPEVLAINHQNVIGLILSELERMEDSEE